MSELYVYTLVRRLHVVWNELTSIQILCFFSSPNWTRRNNVQSSSDPQGVKKEIFKELNAVLGVVHLAIFTIPNICIIYANVQTQQTIILQ